MSWIKMQNQGLALLAALALAVAAPAAAQEKHPPMNMQNAAAMHCGGMMTEAMMQAHGRAGRGGESMMREMMGPPSPAMILRHKGELGLSAAQVTQLESLQKQGEASCTQHMQLGIAGHKAANELLDAASPDFAAYTAKMKEATAHMVEGRVAMAKAAVAARAVLTPQQREKWKSLMEKMHGKP